MRLSLGQYSSTGSNMTSNFIDFTGRNSDADDYVCSTMDSQRIFKVDAPTIGGRKRNLSLPSVSQSTVKKAKAATVLPQDSSPARVIATARHTLHNDTPQRSQVDTAELGTQVKSDSSVEALIKKHSRDVHKMFDTLSSKMDKLESGLEQRISAKI